MAEINNMNNNDQQQQLKMSQRLRFIQFPREQPLPDKTDLYWPCLFYHTMGEAAAVDFHEEFQLRIGMEILDPEFDGVDTDKPICRLLGFEDGTFAKLASDRDLLTFVPNLGKNLVTEKNKDQFFDLTLEGEQQLYTLYQDAVKEARVIMRQSRVVAPGGLNIQVRKKQKTEDHHNNDNGGGGGGGDDKPEDDSSNSFAAKMDLPAAARPPLQAAQQNHQVVQQNQHVQEVAREEPATQAQEVAAAVTAEPEPTKDKDPKPPGTPPFHRPSDIEANEPWANVWNKMRYAGWNRRTNRDVEDDYIFTKPDKNTYDGTEGIDYFTSTRKVQRYVQSKIPHWQAPAPIADDDGSTGPQQPLVEDEEEVEGRPISSAATVVTAGSISPQISKKSTGRSRRASRPAPPSTSSIGPDKLWWQGKSGKREKTYTIPTLADVRHILIKLGIRRDSDGVFHLPENTSANVETPELHDSDSLRKYLCSKGIPQVRNMNLIEKTEQELLHRWVSFAYVPLDKLEGKLTEVTLPSNDKMVALLSKFRFEKCDETYFPPKVDHCGVKRDLRIPGVHFFRGLSELRDYIRRSASFTWTEDELEVKEDDVTGDPNGEFLIRLWAASSPAPLLTYKTSEQEIQHMDKTFAEAEFSVESDSEEKEEADDESSVDSNEAEQSHGSPDASCTSSSRQISSPEDNSEDDESEEESSEDETPSPMTRRATKATGKRVREPEEPKRQVSRRKNARPIKSINQKPWWTKEYVPSFDTMRPILKKLGIVQDKEDGVFILPGKGKSDNLKDPEKLRKCLCSSGIPKFSSINAKPCLSERQRELLRRWVSFANVPVDSDDSVEELEKVSGLLDKHFSRENHIIPFIGRFGFQRNSEGDGYFPPGIDELGRDRKVRKEHLKDDLAQVREYIRCSEKLHLSRPKTQDGNESSDYSSDEESYNRSDSNLLALRLWGALEPTPLRSYEVGSSVSAAGEAGNQLCETPTSAILSKQKKKKSTKAAPDIPSNVALPDWWTARNQDCLADTIRELKERENKSTGRRRGPAPHMTWQQLELACEVRSTMESAVITSPRKGKEPITIDDQIFDLAEEWNIADSRLKAFLSGDEKMLVRKEVLREIEGFFRKWLGKDPFEDEVKVDAFDTIKLSKDGPAPEKGNSKDAVDSKNNKEASEGKNNELNGLDGLQEVVMAVEENDTVAAAIDASSSASKLPRNKKITDEQTDSTIEIKSLEATEDVPKEIPSPTDKTKTTDEECMVVDTTTEDWSGDLEATQKTSNVVVDKSTGVAPMDTITARSDGSKPTDDGMVDNSSTDGSSGVLKPSCETNCSATPLASHGSNKTDLDRLEEQKATDVCNHNQESFTNQTEDYNAAVANSTGEEAQHMDPHIQQGTEEYTSALAKNEEATKDETLQSQDDHLVTEPFEKDAGMSFCANDANEKAEVSFMTDKIELKDDEYYEPDRTQVFGGDYACTPVKFGRSIIELAADSPEQTTCNMDSRRVTDYANDTGSDFLTQPPEPN